MPQIAVLRGDGIGPEVVAQALRVLSRVRPDLQFQEALVGGAAYDATGHPLPPETLELCKRSDAVLLGAVGGPKWDSVQPANMRPEVGALLPLRSELNLYANVRPARTFPALLSASPLKDENGLIDLVVMRELTGGIYFGRPRERRDEGKTAIDTCVYSAAEVERIARRAFAIAQSRRKHVTSVDKANVLETSRLWRETVNRVAGEFPGVTLEHMLVDNCAMQLIRNPKQFDVILTENMFGDILSDEASVITGSLGMLPSASLSDPREGAVFGLYEPSHGSAPDIAGQNKANPIATILSAAMMLDYSFGDKEGAQRVERAVEETLQAGYRTPDLGPGHAVGTQEMGDQILAPMSVVTVVGGGFAGVEAAWTVARSGLRVRLFEMRPVQMTPAHKTDLLAELVCSNSFKSKLATSPAGQLKAEMTALGSLILKLAEEHSVPGGEALAVDRDRFARAVTDGIEGHPLIEIVRRPFVPEDVPHALDQGSLILATGPLTSSDLAGWLAAQTGKQNLYFYDAVSLTVDASTLDRSVIFAQSRYEKGEGDDYLNCPFNKEEYLAFVAALRGAERAPIHSFESDEKIKYFAGCTPIEVIADGGERSLAFGNFKPVGLTDPRTGRRPYAALQLRPENREKSLYSLVACQTRLKWGEQKRIFAMVPGLERAEFVRYGVIHRNTYVEAPKVLGPNLELLICPGIYIAGQLTGVEGYVESAAMGIYAGLQAVARASGTQLPCPPRASAYGSLLSHLQDETPREFAPMNINWGLFPDPDEETRDKGVRRALKLKNAQASFEQWRASNLLAAPAVTSA